MRRHERKESEGKRISRTRERNSQPAEQAKLNVATCRTGRSKHGFGQVRSISYLKYYRVAVATGQESAGEFARSSALEGFQIVTVSRSESQIAATAITLLVIAFHDTFYSRDIDRR